MTEDAKRDAQKRIQELLDQSKEKVQEAMAIADEHGLEFGYEPDHIGTYYGKGNKDLYGEDGLAEGEWYPSSWSSSSIYC